MKRLPVLTITLSILCLGARPSAAFTVESAFTAGCHELVTGAAFFHAGLRFAEVAGVEAPDGNWEQLLAYLYPALDLERFDKFVFFSLLAGARAPDSEGFSLTNLASLRAIQGDPNGQYVHCLRAPEDDGDAGNAQALAGCRRSIFEQLVKAADVSGEAVITIPFALDNYGSFEVQVLRAPYFVGRALHTFQDSFTHSLRSPDFRGVVHVMNYEAAIEGTLVEERDGMAHSGGADTCSLIATTLGDLVNRERVFAAIEASADLLRAFGRFIRLRHDGALTSNAELEAVFIKWMQVADPRQLGDYEVCSMANDYCDSPWLETARITPAGPTFSCRASPGLRGEGGSSPGPLGPGALAGLLVSALLLRRRGRRG